MLPGQRLPDELSPLIRKRGITVALPRRALAPHPRCREARERGWGRAGLRGRGAVHPGPAYGVGAGRRLLGGDPICADYAWQEALPKMLNKRLLLAHCS